MSIAVFMTVFPQTFTLECVSCVTLWQMLSSYNDLRISVMISVTKYLYILSLGIDLVFRDPLES
jgi:hypothetical protein